MQITADGVLLRSLPNPLTTAEASRIHDGDQLFTEVSRTTVKLIARFKARKPEPPRQPMRLTP